MPPINDVKPVQGDKMMFIASQALYPAKYRDLKLIPFFRIGVARYMIYWKQIVPGSGSNGVKSEIDPDDGRK